MVTFSNRRFVGAQIATTVEFKRSEMSSSVVRKSAPMKAEDGHVFSSNDTLCAWVHLRIHLRQPAYWWLAYLKRAPFETQSSDAV